MAIATIKCSCHTFFYKVDLVAEFAFLRQQLFSMDLSFSTIPRKAFPASSGSSAKAPNASINLFIAREVTVSLIICGQGIYETGDYEEIKKNCHWFSNH
jgi:hypothetical protein